MHGPAQLNLSVSIAPALRDEIAIRRRAISQRTKESFNASQQAKPGDHHVQAPEWETLRARKDGGLPLVVTGQIVLGFSGRFEYLGVVFAQTVRVLVDAAYVFYVSISISPADPSNSRPFYSAFRLQDAANLTRDLDQLFARVHRVATDALTTQTANTSDALWERFHETTAHCFRSGQSQIERKKKCLQ